MNQLELFKSYIVGDFNNEKQTSEKQVTHLMLSMLIV